MEQNSASILLIYTGGTIGMKQDPETLALAPFNFSQITGEVPELKKFGCQIDTISFDPLIDSSDADIPFWQKLVSVIEKEYCKYDGFVILHGTDTMSYTASALSFMLQNLEKPVILTGSQLPIGVLRTDGKENLISSIEIAAARDKEGHPMVPEVCIFFESQLYRGNRTTKYSAENFRAFRSASYHVLAEAGIHIKYYRDYINYPDEWGKPLRVESSLDPNVAILKIFPGISKSIVDSIIDTKGLRAIVLETFGSGNAPTKEWFIKSIKRAVDMEIIVLNITQCHAGYVDMNAYTAGVELKKAGVLSGYDSTTEAAVTKLFFLLSQNIDYKIITRNIDKNISGEITKH